MPKNALNEAIGIYKMRATIRHLKEQASPVVLMDADAMVLDRACFDELFAYEEDMVAQMEGHLACPAAVEESIGFTINTGMILFRPSMLAVLELLVELRDNQTCTQAADWMRHEHSRITCPRNESQGTRIGYRYRAHCSDQEILNTIVRFSRPHWTTYGSVLQFTPTRYVSTPHLARSKQTLSVRMLDARRWRFAFHTGKNVSVKLHRLAAPGTAPDTRLFPFPRGPQGPGVCLAHAAGLVSALKIPIMQDRGVWYL